MNRSLAGLAAVAVVLVALVLIFANPFRDELRRDEPKGLVLFEGFRPQNADRVEIEAAGADPVILTRQGEAWVVESQGSFPADSAAVGAMLRAVEIAKSTRLASTNPDNRSKFQVDSAGVVVRLSGGDRVLAAFTVGKVGRDFASSYVRPEDSNDVHEVRGLNRGLFSRPQGLRDRSLFSFEIASVRSVILSGEESGWEIANSDTGWTVQGRGSETVALAKREAVDELLRVLSRLSADGFLDASTDTLDTGLADPRYTVRVAFMNGSEASLAVGNQNSDRQHFAARPDRDAVYLLGEWRVNNIVKPYEDLVTADANGTDPDR
jgi:hypothetical protein